MILTTKGIETIEWPMTLSVQAVTTNRQAGYSLAPFDSLNMGDHVGDDNAAVARNRAEISGPVKVHWLNQVHGNRVINVDETPYDNTADAAISRRANHAVAVMTADCLPILMTDENGSFVAAVHCGWRSLAAGILANTLSLADPQGQLLVWLGPCISSRQFEVGEEVLQQFAKRQQGAEQHFNKQQNGKHLADLHGLAIDQLTTLANPMIIQQSECTFERRDKFFSYRRDGQTGRMASAIWLTP